MYIIIFDALVLKNEVAVGFTGDAMNASPLEHAIGKRMVKLFNDSVKQITEDCMADFGVKPVAGTYRKESKIDLAEHSKAPAEKPEVAHD
jgi:hypothetical protein